MPRRLLNSTSTFCFNFICNFVFNVHFGPYLPLGPFLDRFYRNPFQGHIWHLKFSTQKVESAPHFFTLVFNVHFGPNLPLGLFLDRFCRSPFQGVIWHLEFSTQSVGDAPHFFSLIFFFFLALGQLPFWGFRFSFIFS